MADRALTEEALFAGLRDIRLPDQAAGGVLAEVLAALALGLVVAVVLGLVLRMLTLARPVAATAATDVSTLPEEEQTLALLRILKANAPERYAALRGRIYQAGGLPDLAELRQEVARHV
jgi:hypothetical protein